MAFSRAEYPCVLLLRRQGQRRASEVAALILANLDDIAKDLETGAVVVLGEHRIRIRSLPTSPG